MSQRYLGDKSFDNDLKKPETIERNEKKLKWLLSLLSWEISIALSIIGYFLSKAGTRDDLVCKIDKQYGVIGFFIMMVSLYLIILLVLYKIKLNILIMIKNNELEKSSGTIYAKSFNKFFIFELYVLFRF